MISTTDLTFAYPDQPDISFPNISIEKTSSILILGESGCGKTTLLHLLAGLLTPKSGSIKIASTNLSDLSNAARDQFRGKHIGLVYQKPYFIESLNCLDNLMISPYSSDRENAISMASQLGIDSLLSKRPSQLSVGEQQRLSIGRALMAEPNVILADEPTSALDNRNCEVVIDLLITHSKKHNAALIIVTHDERLKSVIKTQTELAPIGGAHNV
jgi:putative ABC transport system ATP-binding protein